MKTGDRQAGAKLDRDGLIQLWNCTITWTWFD
jgi:hypothetical protein